MNRTFTFFVFCWCSVTAFAQKQVAITIDDVPNTKLGTTSLLLQRIDSMQFPATIFINEVKLEHNDAMEDNVLLLEKWIAHPNITAGNHTYSHKRSSTHSVEAYLPEIEKGETETRRLVEKHNKKLEHFRFPYNDLGRDSLQQDSLKEVLEARGYRIAPFTIESSDWMFNAVYRHFLKEGNTQKAAEMGELYVQYTLALFDFYDSVGVAQYGRHIKQIYLCHDNELNRDYLIPIVKDLQQRNYSIISYDNALSDPIYDQQDYFHRKYGISWLYRWIGNVNDRNAMGRAEPTCPKLEKAYQKL